MAMQDIYNFHQVDDQIATGGQPTAAQLGAAAAAGWQTVINLATIDPRYSLPDEGGLVASLGMTYVHIPVVWEDPQPADFASFEAAMAEHEGKKIFIHCAANYRVTAFFGLYAQKHLGWSEEEAEALRGPIWGDGEYPAWETFVREQRRLMSAEK